MKFSFTSKRLDTTTAITFVMASLLTLAPMWLGGVSAVAQCTFGVLAAVGFLVLNGEMRRRRRRIRAGIWVKLLLVMAVFSLLQVVPYPLGLVELVSPKAGEFYRSMGELLGVPVDVVPFSLHPSATLLAGVRIITLAFLFMLVVERVRKSEREGPLLVEGIVAVGALVLVLTFVQSFFTTGPLLGSYAPSSEWIPRRIVSTFINENHQAAFFNLMGFTALGLSLNELSFRKSSAYGILGLMMLVSSVLSGSRAAWGATLIGGILYLVLCQENTRLLRQPVRFWSFVGAVASVVMVGLLLLSHSPDGVLFAEGGEGLDTKLEGMLVAISTAVDYPAVGVGADAFIDVAAGYNDMNPNLTLTHPENGFLQLVTDYGLLMGLFFGIALTAFGGSILWMGISRHDMLGAVVGIITVCIQNLADFSLSVPGVAFPVVALLAIMDGQTFMDGKSRESRGIPRRVAVGLSLIGVMMAGFAGAYATFTDSDSVDKHQRNQLREAVAGIKDVVGEVDNTKNRSSSLTKLSSVDVHPQVERYMKLRPADGHPLFIHALMLEGLEEYSSAQDWLDQAKKRAPFQLSIRLQDARYKERNGKREESAQLYRNILDERWGERTKIATHLVATAKAMKSRGVELKERVAFLNDCLPKEPQKLLNVLFTLKQGGLVKEGLQSLQARVTKFPDDLELRSGLAGELVGLKEARSLAEFEVTQLIARHPEAGEGYYFQGMLYESDGKEQQAWAMYKEAYKRTGSLLRAAMGQYRMEVALGRWEGVRDAVGRIRGKLGKDKSMLAEMHRLLSLTAEAEGNMDEAIVEMELATRLRPGQYDYWRRLAMLSEATGQKGRALDAYEAVMARDPLNEEAKKEVKRLREVWAPFAP